MRPIKRVGHVGRHGGGDEHLLAVGHHSGEPLTATGVELGEDVVEDEHGVVPEVVPEQVERRELQPEGERPRLSVARIPLRRQVAEGQHDVVAVRPDEADAALHLRSPHLRQGGEHLVVQLADLGHLTGRDPTRRLLPQRRAVGDAGVGLAGADLLVGLAQVGAEVAEQAEPGVEELGADLREVGVPDVERVESGLPLGCRVDPLAGAPGGRRGGRLGAAPAPPT